MAESLTSRFRVVCLFLIILVGFGAVFSRLVYLHVVAQPELLSFVETSRHREDVIPARRGKIVDSRGNLLAFTRTFWTVGVDPVAAEGQVTESELVELAQILNISLAQAHKAFQIRVVDGRARRWAKLAERIDRDQMERLGELDVAGVYGNAEFVRHYPGHTHGSHILGFVNAEHVGVTGLERTFDFYLRGQNGWRESERDGKRRELAQFRSREIPSRDGLNLELSLDQVVQHLAEDALAWTMENFKPQAATIIVSEPSTGFLLALANAPDFDPNHYSDYPVETHRNLALTDVYEPGSTFKIVAASAALEEGLVTTQDRFDTSLSAVNYKGRRVRLPKDSHTYDELSMAEIVIKSSNRGAAFLGMMLGEDRLHAYTKDFGFGEETGIFLPGEVSGTLHPVKRWDGLTISRLPMGHAIAATPMQVHMSMSVLANEGILMEPQLVRRIFDDSGETLATYSPRARRRVVSMETARRMTALLAEVVGEQGTARKAELEGFQVAGKTGTTQKIVDGRYSNQHHVASFSGYFPAANPRVVVTVVVDEPDIGRTGYGGAVAAPVFQRLGEGIAQYLRIETIDAQHGQNMLAWEGGRHGSHR